MATRPFTIYTTVTFLGVNYFRAMNFLDVLQELKFVASIIELSKEIDPGSTMAQMVYFSFPYYFTIPNAEFRNRHFKFFNSEL